MIKATINTYQEHKFHSTGTKEYDDYLVQLQITGLTRGEADRLQEELGKLIVDNNLLSKAWG